MITVRNLTSEEIISLGRDAFKKEFDEMTVVDCPFPKNSEAAALYFKGYDEMDQIIQSSLQALAA